MNLINLEAEGIEKRRIALIVKIGGQHPTPLEPSAMSKGTTTKARKQAIEIPTLRMVSGL